jgi:hypothetical protein
VIIAKKSKF